VVVEEREARAAHRAVGEVAEDAAVEVPGRAHVLPAHLELEGHAATLGGGHPHADERGDVRALVLTRHDALQVVELAHGVRTVLIASPLRITSNASDQSSSGAVRVTIAPRSSFPSVAHCASRGKSTCGRWSPPCETITRARFANASASTYFAVSPGTES